MKLFTKTADEQEIRPAFLKMGVYGDSGAGKSFSAAEVAIGLSLYVESLKFKRPPVLMVDTEKGSQWLVPKFKRAGVTFYPYMTRAFKDLKQAIADAEEANAILIVDSMTHFWEDVQASFLQAKRARLNKPYAKLELPDWGVIKPAWKTDFVEPFLTSKAHIILCGRSGDVREVQEDEETGKKEMLAVGTKMAAEKGLSYEPNLVCEMTKVETRGGRGTARHKSIIRRATVLKDRSDALDGLYFDDPTFENFLPHIKFCKIGGVEPELDVKRNSASLFPSDERDNRPLQRKILVEKIMDLLSHHVPGQTADAKAQRRDAFVDCVGTTSQKEFEELMSLEDLKAAYAKMQKRFGAPEKAAAQQTLAEQLDDGLPDFDAAPAKSAKAQLAQAIDKADPVDDETPEALAYKAAYSKIAEDADAGIITNAKQVKVPAEFAAQAASYLSGAKNALASRAMAR